MLHMIFAGTLPVELRKKIVSESVAIALPPMLLGVFCWTVMVNWGVGKNYGLALVCVFISTFVGLRQVQFGFRHLYAFLVGVGVALFYVGLQNAVSSNLDDPDFYSWIVAALMGLGITIRFYSEGPEDVPSVG